MYASNQFGTTNVPGMQPLQGAPAAADDVPWWLRYGARGAGCGGGVGKKIFF